jgi:hypothetical protein
VLNVHLSFAAHLSVQGTASCHCSTTRVHSSGSPDYISVEGLVCYDFVGVLRMPLGRALWRWPHPEHCCCKMAAL